MILPTHIAHFFDPVRDGIRAAAAAAVGRLLKLTPDQSERLKTILDDFVKYHEDLESQIEDVRATGRNRIVQILTPEQRKRFEQLSDKLPTR